MRIFFLLLLSLGLNSTAAAQEAYVTGGPARPNAIFFSGVIGMSEGFNVFRVDAGNEVLLTQEPVRPAIDAAAFFDISRQDPERMMKSLDVESPNEVYLRLRIDRTVGVLHAIVDPNIARALGRLWVDSSATTMGATISNATYRVVVVDGLDQPTDRSTTISVEPRTLPVPDDVRSSYADRLITLYWEYPPGTPESGDPVTSFYVLEEAERGYSIVSGGRTLRQVGMNSYSTTIEAGDVNGQRSFRISASDFAGNQSGVSEETTVEVVDDIPPPAVSQLEATELTSRSVQVSWTYDAEVIQTFEVYRSADVRGEYEMVASTNPDVRTYTDETVEPGNVYHYQVGAVDAATNASKRTITRSVLVHDFEPPPTPGDLEATVTGAIDDGGQRIRLEWSSVSAADLNTYVILRRNVTHDRKQPFAHANSMRVSEPIFVDDGPTGLGFEVGAFYQFGVLAADSSANVSDTVLVTIQIPDNIAPEAPVLQARFQDAGVTISWNPSSSRDVIRYNLERRVLSEKAHTVADSTAEFRFERTVSAYTDRDVLRGDTYVYALVAIDSLGNESPASVDTVAVREAGLPRSVRNVAAVLADRGVAITWSPGPENTADRFRIYRSSDTGAFQLVGEAVTISTYLDAGGASTSAYYVTRVINDGRESARSRTVGVR